MLKSATTRLIKKMLKRYEKSYLFVIVDLFLLFMVITTVWYGLHKLKKPETIVFRPGNNQISNLIDPKKIDLSKSMIAASFSWKNNLMERSNMTDTLTVNLKNTAPYNINNLKISLYEKNTNILNGQEIKIGALAQGEDKTIEQSIKIEVPKEKLNVNLKAAIEYEVFGKKIREEFSLPEIKLQAFIEAEAFALYNTPEGDKLGLGPLPPVVGEPTSYWAFFDIKTFGDISDFTLKAHLNQNTDFSNNYSLLSGKLSYNPENKEITWHIPGIISGEDKHRLGIEIMFLPEENEVASKPIMIDNIKYFAIDENTQLEISDNLSNISTDIIRDQINPNNGEVLPAKE